jgi:hypothetical protein
MSNDLAYLVRSAASLPTLGESYLDKRSIGRNDEANLGVACAGRCCFVRRRKARGGTK